MRACLLVFVGLAAVLAFEADFIERVHDNFVNFCWLKLLSARRTLIAFYQPRFYTAQAQ
jgi:hypothetical protein